MKSVYEFLGLLRGVKTSGENKWTAFCPSHDDRKPSLSVAIDNETLLVHCHAGCTLEQILQAVKLTKADLFLSDRKPNAQKPEQREIDVIYHYTDAKGIPFEVVRTNPKGFYQRQADGKGGYLKTPGGRYTMRGIVWTLYHQDKLKQAIDGGKEIFLVEGEKDVQRLEREGLVSTSNPMGAGKWRSSYSEALRGADLIIIPDNDSPGVAHVNKAAADTHGKAKRVRILTLPQEFRDVSHYLDSGGDIQQLLKLAALCPTYEIPQVAVTEFDFTLTDLGNAERLVHQFEGTLRYCWERKLWLVWNNKIWEWDMGAKIMQLATKTVRSIYHEAADEPDDKKRKELADHAKRSENHQRLEAMIKQAKARPGILVEVEELDKDAWLLNCNNGTINLKTGNLQPHDKRDFITMLVPLDYVPEARSDEWDNFLAMIFEKKESLISYVQKALGYSLTGSQAEQAIFFCHGGGWNGKSTLLGAVTDIFGPYSQEIEPEAFMVKKYSSGGPNESIADLYRKRLVCSTEVEEGQKLSVTLIKRMTGGERLRHERKWEHGFNFLPSYKLWLSGNHEPRITDTTNSFWNRLKRIPFKVSISEQKRIKDYRHILSGGYGEAILAWLVKGCIQWQKQGLGEPPEVLEAIKKYREDQDILLEFLNENCGHQPSATITVADLYKAYKRWCDETLSYFLGKKTFGDRLKEKGFTSTSGTGNKATWTGIRLLTDEEKVNLVKSINGFSHSFLYEKNYKKDTEKRITKLTKLTEPPDDPPDYPHERCPTCGGDDFWETEDNRYLCSRCHPEPKGETG